MSHRRSLQVILFLTGMLLSSIAAFYSVTGLARIFSGALVPVLVMGGALELAKIVGVSWVFRYWRDAPKLLVAYVSIGVMVLMLLTGIGIFGYLSRAYLVQQAPLVASVSERTTLERAVTIARDAYTRDEAALNAYTSKNSADQIIARLTERDRLSGSNGAVGVMRSQQTVQRELQTRTRESAKELQAAEQALVQFDQRTREQTVDVGPLIFIAKAWYHDTSVDVLDRTVTFFILIIISVFDPMAIALLLAAQSLSRTAPAPPAEPPAPSALSVPSTDAPAMPIPETPPTAANVVAAIDTAHDMIIDPSTHTDTLAEPTLDSPLPVERPKFTRARRVRAAEAHRLSHA